MLGRRQQNALLHQAGGVADARHIADMRFNFKIVEVNTAEDDARIGWRRNETHAAADRRVQSNSFGFSRSLDGKLTGHNDRRIKQGI